MSFQIVLKDLAIGYRGRPLLSGIHLSIKAGEFWGIVGPNGSGKTTLLKTLLGILRPVAGRVEKAHGLSLGYVPQRGVLDDIFPLTALDVVLMGRYSRIGLFRQVSKADQERALAALDKVGMAHLARKPFRALSGGQKQRTLMARALAMEPDVLILDEPTDGMDIAGQHTLMELIFNLHRESGRTVLMSNHTLTLIANYAEKLMLIHADDQIFEVGKTSDLLTAERLKRLYRVEVAVHSLDGSKQVVVRRAQTPRERG